MSSIGLTNDGKFIIQPDADIGGRWAGDSGDYNTSNSALWTKLRNNRTFANRIAERYRQLRDELWFTEDKFLEYYEDQTINQLGQRYFNEDAFVKYIDRDDRKWIHLALGTRLEATRRWLRERFIYLDSIYEYGEYLKFGIMRSNVYGKAVVGIKTYSPMMLRVKMTSAAVMKQYVSRHNSGTRDGYYEFEYTFTNDHDNEITIYGAPHIMTFRSLEDLALSSFEMGEAERLTEVVCRNSGHLVRLEVSNNRMLQKVDVYNCRKLGSVTQYSTLDLSKCVHLRHLNAGGTKIGSILLNRDGGVLDYLNLNSTYIRDLTLIGQEYLNDMDITDCLDLSTVRLEGCNALTSVEIPNSKISEFSVVDCNLVTKINVSKTGYLRRLDLSGCPNLLDLDISNTSNPAIKEIDLRLSEKLTKLNISGCTALNGVWLSEKATNISDLNLSNSAIKYFRFGREEAPSYLDLSRFNIDTISFNNCSHVEEIRNANIGRTNYASGAVFKGCVNLHTIHGYLRLGGSCTGAFSGCTKLVNFPSEFELYDVTSASEMFSGCKSITLTKARDIMHRLVSLSGSTWLMFNGCTGIVSDDVNNFPSDFFSKCLKIKSLYSVFNGCGNISGPFPYGIYDNLTELTEIRGPFGGTKLISTDKMRMDEVFKFNTKLITLYNPFSGIRLDDAPTKNLLYNLTALTNVGRLFDGQRTMYSTHSNYFIDPDFFETNLNINNVSFIFNECQVLDQGIPDGIFRNNRKIIDASNAFSGCKNIRGIIPENLFPTNIGPDGNIISSLQNINYLFNNCSGLYGRIPESLFLNHNKILYAKYVFGNCSSIAMELGMVPDNIFHDKYLLQDIEGFFSGCTNMVYTLPADLFRDSIAINNIGMLFNGCERLSGVIPEGFFNCTNSNGDIVNNKITTAHNVFRGCKGLTGRIPEDLFSKFREVTALNSFFEHCTNLKGNIPRKLFYECRNLVNLNNFLYQANSFGTEILPEEDDAEFGRYIIHPTTFSRCSNLKYMQYMFYNCHNFTGDLHEDTFKSLMLLENTQYMFAVTKCTGNINRSTFINNSNLVNMEAMFSSANLTSITIDAIRPEVHRNLTGLSGCFGNNKNMTGEAPRLWITHPGASKAGCFSNCTLLDNYSEIPTQWGGPNSAQ